MKRKKYISNTDYNPFSGLHFVVDERRNDCKCYDHQHADYVDVIRQREPSSSSLIANRNLSIYTPAKGRELEGE